MALGVLAGVGVLAACGGRGGDDGYEELTIPPPPPKEVRVDETTGAILSRPATDWQWLDGAALKALEPTAVLGLRSGKACEGWVTVVDHAEPTPRAAAAAMLAARKAEAGWEVHVDEDALYASHTARRWEIQRRDGDQSISERTTFLVEGPRLYTVHARVRDALYATRRRCLDAVTAAFDVMPYTPAKKAP